MTDKKEVVAAEPAEVIPADELTPLSMIAQVIENPDFDVQKLEKMMDLQERWEDRLASKAFNEAVAKFQDEVPTVIKDKKGAHDIKYAPLDTIMKTIQPALSANGLSVRFSTTMQDSAIRAVCTVSHVSGHSEASEITVPVDAAMSANSSQKMGSANSYAKRYALSNALNLAFAETDNDANDLYERLNDDQVIEINDLLKESGADKARFLKWAGNVKSVEDIAKRKYYDCKAQLERKRGNTD